MRIYNRSSQWSFLFLFSVHIGLVFSHVSLSCHRTVAFICNSGQSWSQLSGVALESRRKTSSSILTAESSNNKRLIIFQEKSVSHYEAKNGKRKALKKQRRRKNNRLRFNESLLDDQQDFKNETKSLSYGSLENPFVKYFSNVKSFPEDTNNISFSGMELVPCLTKKQLKVTLQLCMTPTDVLKKVGRFLSQEIDSDGSISSMVLKRILKQCIFLDNQFKYCVSNQLNPLPNSISDDDLVILFDVVIETFLSAVGTYHPKDSGTDTTNIHDVIVESFVEGTKAIAVLLRILYGWKHPSYSIGRDQSEFALSRPLFNSIKDKIVEEWNVHCQKNHIQDRGIDDWFQDHHITGLKWSFDTLTFIDRTFESLESQPWNSESISLPISLQYLYEKKKIPFSVHPGMLLMTSSLNTSLPSVCRLENEVDFGTDVIITGSSMDDVGVPERRKTAWLGDASVGPFAYSGKKMQRSDWSPSVRMIRDHLHKISGQYYDSCLLNLYNTVSSGMRYHVDPDQGKLWDYDTAVVSVGATRKFAFRSIKDNKVKSDSITSTRSQRKFDHPHTFLVMDGDVTHMYEDCQVRFQHAVKKSDYPQETAIRASMVFKRTYNYEHFIQN